MKKAARILLVTFVSLVLLVGTVLVAMIFYAESESGSQKIFATVAQVLSQKAGLAIQSEQMSFRIFSGLHFKNLQVQDQKSPESLSLQIGDFDLSYSLSLLKRHFEVSELKLHGVNLSCNRRSTAGQGELTKVDQTDDSQAGLPSLLERVQGILQNVPVEVSLKNVDVDNVVVDCRIDSPKAKLDVRVPNFSLHGDLEIRRDLLLGDLLYQLGNMRAEKGSDLKQGRFQFESKAPTASASAKANQSGHAGQSLLKFSTGLRSRAEIGFVFQPHGGSWALEIKPSQFQVLMDRFDFSQPSGAGATEKNELQIAQQKLDCKASMDDKIRFQCVDQIEGLLKNDFNKKKLNVQVNLEGSLDQKLQNLNSKLNFDLEHEAMHLNAQSDLQFGSQLGFVSKGSLDLSTKLPGVIDKFAALEKTGSLHFNFDLNGHLSPPENKPLNKSENKQSTQLKGTVDLVSGKFGSWATRLQTEVTQTSNHADPRNSQLTVSTQLSLSQLSSVASSKSAHQDQVQLPVRLVAPLEVQFSMDKLGEELSVKADVQAEKILTYTETAKKTKAESIWQGLRTALAAHLDLRSKNFSIEHLQLTARDPNLELTVEGTGNLQRKDLNSQVKIRIPNLESLKAMAPLHDHLLKGALDVPFEMTVLGGSDVNVNGRIESKNISWLQKDFAASGISGVVAFEEKIHFDGKNFHFANLISQNPFERADFEKIRPLLTGTEPLQISRINWLEKSYGPFVGVVMLQQNMFMAKQFDLDLVSGRVFGEVFGDLNTKSLQFGMLARWTGIDLEEILPERFLKNMKAKQHEILSGRTGFVVNLNRASVDGRFDLTQVGSRQLLTMLALLDPNYEDAKFNKLRSALQLGFPTSMMLNFADGFLNLDVTLSVLGLENRQVISGIPISSFVQKAVTEVLHNLENVPLQ